MRARSRRISALFSVKLLLVALAACNTASRPSAPPLVRDASALGRMERLTLTANRCWFQSKDPSFRDYSLAPELSSFSGRPRFLLVPKGKLEAKPLLVVEGSNGSSEVATYGPVMAGALAGRVSGDIRRWNAGDSACDV